MNVKISDNTIAISMRSVVRAAYSGRLAGSSDTGFVLQLAKRLQQVPARFGEEHQQAKNQNRTATMSQRLKIRGQPPTEIGTINRMPAMPGSVSILVTRSS